VTQQPSSQRKVCCDMTECMYPKTTADVVTNRTSQSTQSGKCYIDLYEMKIEIEISRKADGDFEKKICWC